MAAGDTQRVGNLLLREFQFRSQLLGRRRALVLLLEAGERLVDLVQRAYLVERQAHDARLLGQSLEDRLTDPPHGIGDELEAAGLVELLGGLDQPEVALVNQVGEAQSLILVLLGYGHHETQVGFGELLERFLVSFLNSLGEFHLLLDRDKLLLADFLQVLVQRGAFAVGDGLCNL